MKSNDVRLLLNILEEFIGAVRADPRPVSEMPGRFWFADLTELLIYDEDFKRRMAQVISKDAEYYAPASPELLADQFQRLLLNFFQAVALEAVDCVETGTIISDVAAVKTEPPPR